MVAAPTGVSMTLVIMAVSDGSSMANGPALAVPIFIST